MDEIANKNKTEEQLILWLNSLIRVVLQPAKDKSAVNIFCMSIIKRVQWFYSSNHLKVYNLFEKFLLTFLSLYSQNVEMLYKYLIEKVDLEEK